MCSVDLIDQEAEREGAAALRLFRLTGARAVFDSADGFSVPVKASPIVRATKYSRMSAADAFQRLFRGESMRHDLPCTRADRERQKRQQREREIDRALGSSLLSLSPDQAREALRSMRYRA